ncbi:hypothetical protein EXIGLDRAFT_774469 [Exidia glandulosa HHB12029]|uniref:Holliday junction resolvase Gen1 C-terminal domain-containing protein n=1 Tax=Exidia glandulosa HHB12029 TaxID=1314781 RepID=A0A165EC62_EXIGL|nr:hypothetical protein EXIGLDRAFT_774469 [Exidia glandulosa HHB12029]
MQQELRTNSRGIIGKKLAKLASSFPQEFPDLKVVDAYVNPIVSASSGQVTTIEWRREPNLSDLAKLCEMHFEWGYTEAILKRFRTVIWPGAVCRILRRSVLQADDLAAAAERRTVPGTPRKAGAKDDLALGTPSKMITQYFSRLEINSPHVRAFDEPDATPLITKIHSERRNASTDMLKEYRLEISPLQLARLAEQGVTGSRPAPSTNPYADSADEDEDDADEDEDGGKKKGKRVPKAPVDPKTVLRVWMPASMVELVEPRLVREYEELKERKRLKKEGKAAPKERKTKTSKDAPPKSTTTRKPKVKASAKNKYFSDSDGGVSESEVEVENIPIGGSATSAKAKAQITITSATTTTTTTTTMQAPQPALNSTRLFAQPAAKSKKSLSASRSSAASSSSLRSKTAMVADLFAPSPEKPAGFFSDEDGQLCGSNALKGKGKKQPLFYPSSSDEEDVFKVPAIPTYTHPATTTTATTTMKTTSKGQKRDSSRTDTGSDSDSNAIRKSPRKNKLQTSPRADGARRRVEPLFLPEPDSDQDVPAPSKRQPAPFPMKAKAAPAARKVAAADVIVISSSDDEMPARAKPKHAPVRCVDGVIDLT